MPTATIVNKGWGREVIFASKERYAGKLLEFNPGGKFSMHFHRIKDETWYVLKGEFRIKVINTKNADTLEQILKEGDIMPIPPCLPHQLECLSEGGCTIIEVSTMDDPKDNYRVGRGDSQS